MIFDRNELFLSGIQSAYKGIEQEGLLFGSSFTSCVTPGIFV